MTYKIGPLWIDSKLVRYASTRLPERTIEANSAAEAAFVYCHLSRPFVKATDPDQYATVRENVREEI